MQNKTSKFLFCIRGKFCKSVFCIKAFCISVRLPVKTLYMETTGRLLFQLKMKWNECETEHSKNCEQMRAAKGHRWRNTRKMVLHASDKRTADIHACKFMSKHMHARWTYMPQSTNASIYTCLILYMPSSKHVWVSTCLSICMPQLTHAANAWS